jgi:DNA-binding LytR/AlgR family response regulator
MKILVVEDEPKTGDYLRQGLIEAGFVVDLARDGLDGLHLGEQGDYDLAILDVMLPRLDGWQLLAALRRTRPDMPVLFLTARDLVKTASKGWSWVPMITWSNPLLLPNCWPACAPCCAGAAAARSRSNFGWPIWS